MLALQLDKQSPRPAGAGLVERDPLFVEISFEWFITTFVAHLVAVPDPVSQVEIVKITDARLINLAQDRKMTGAAIRVVGVEKGIHRR